MPRLFKHSLSDQRLAFHRSRAQARFRQEPWSEEFTFEQWWEIWRDHWHRRGRAPDDLVLVRRHCDQPWHQENVDLWLRRDWLQKSSRESTLRRWQQWREQGVGRIGYWGAKNAG